MQGVEYAIVAAVFLLCALYLVLRSRRAPTGSTGQPADVASSTAQIEALVESARRVAEAEASSIRQVAQAEAEALRREAAGEQARLAEQRDRFDAEFAASAARLQSTEDRLEEQAVRLDADAAELDHSLTALAQRQRDLETERAALQRHSDELAARRAELDGQVAALTARAGDVDAAAAAVEARAAELDARAADLQQRAAALEARTAEHVRELERVSGLTAEQAKAELLATVESGARRDAAILVRTIENEARTDGTQRARAIVAEAVQRVASEQTTETVVSVLHLPGDEMKGRIIGREGRNIRAFESVTGVNVIIDDTPEAVLLSCFDPVRREVGRLTLERLVLDGRIHPQRIEDVYEQSKAEIDELCLRAARDALVEVGISDIDERLLPTIGRLKYRTSYGQNVLAHLIETAHISGVMAAELGVEPTLVKRCAFLHDIGKALTHEVEGSHAIVGADLLRRFGESEAVAHAVEAHHNEVPPQTIEAVLTQASDTCSAARPGARRESLENYVKRLARIEEIAGAKPGVERVFAMQSGREVRVMVQPGEVDDLAASVIAREIAKQIEDELTYPGQIRVTVVRESRATEIAH